MVVWALVAEGMPASATAPEAETLHNTGLPSYVNLYGVSWKPDSSKALIVGDNSAVVVYDDSSGTFTTVDASAYDNFLLDAGWRPDGLYAMIVGGNGQALAFNGKALTPLSTGSNESLYSVDWKTDSSEALLVGGDGAILQFRDSLFTAVASGTGVLLKDVCYDPTDGSALIVGLNSTVLRLKPDGAVERIPFDGDFSLYCVAWSPQGTLAVICGRGIIATYDGNAVTIISQGTDQNILGCCWAPDGSQALLCGDTGVLVKLRQGKLYAVVTPPDFASVLQDVSYRPDGGAALAVGFRAAVARLPPRPSSAAPCLVENPLVIAGLVLVFGGAAAGWYYLGKKEREGPEPAPPKEAGGKRRRKHRH
jgi:hypothetical protein